MVVFPSGFILSASTPLTHTRIGWHDIARELGLTANDITASSELATGPRDAPLRADTYEYWEAATLPATWRIDLGSLQDINYIGIVASGVGTVEAKTSVDGVSMTTFASAVMPNNDAPIMFLDEEVSARYVELTFTGAGDAPRIAHVRAGSVLAMARPIYGGVRPLTLSRRTTLKTSMNRSGQFIAQTIRRHGIASSVEFKHLTSVWYRSDFDLFVKAARQYPYFLAWRPATFPLEVGYVWTSDDISPSNMGIRNLMQVSWDFEGIGYE